MWSECITLANIAERVVEIGLLIRKQPGIRLVSLEHIEQHNIDKRERAKARFMRTQLQPASGYEAISNKFCERLVDQMSRVPINDFEVDSTIAGQTPHKIGRIEVHVHDATFVEADQCCFKEVQESMSHSLLGRKTNSVAVKSVEN